MTRLRPAFGGVLAGRHYKSGEGISIALKGDAIASVRDGGSGPYLAPGLVDLQINGFRGLDFNTLPVPDDLPGRVTRELWSEGVTSYLATVITNSGDAIEACVGAIRRACERDDDAATGIAGIHLEGPFIAGEDGPRGAHDRRHVCAPDWKKFERWQKASGGRIRLITLSPEWRGAIPFIRRCVASGVTVSIGHTAATPEQIREAVAAGASMSTHLGNGSHLVLPRHPNYIWEQLAQDALAACIIADGFHLPDAVIKTVMRVKGPNAMLASDAVYLSGLKPGKYQTHIGGKVVLTRDGKLHLASNPKLLAGSVRMLIRSVEHLIRAGLTDPGEAWEMASTRPALAMRLEAGRGLAPGAPADLALFDRERDRITLLQTWKGGRKVFERS
ncbi:MAG: amidohydrolase family protein [Planctomycetes bacterium]|nr:amidohydrolase family protein [Planctomycetota bacterium]